MLKNGKMGDFSNYILPKTIQMNENETKTPEWIDILKESIEEFKVNKIKVNNTPKKIKLFKIIKFL